MNRHLMYLACFFLTFSLSSCDVDNGNDGSADAHTSSSSSGGSSSGSGSGIQKDECTVGSPVYAPKSARTSSKGTKFYKAAVTSYDEKKSQDDCFKNPTHKGTKQSPTLWFHVHIARKNGEDAVSSKRIAEMVAYARKEFSPRGYSVTTLQVFNTISSQYWNLSQSEFRALILNYHSLATKNPFAIPVYFVDTIFGSKNTTGAAMRTGLRGIAISANADNSTFVHEIGHVLGLYHTHDTSNGMTPCNNSKCSSTGDLICDTKPDRRSCSTSNCYSTTCADKACKPDPKNFMSYYGSCRSRFSARQWLVMHCVHDTLFE